MPDVVDVGMEHGRRKTDGFLGAVAFHFRWTGASVSASYVLFFVFIFLFFYFSFSFFSAHSRPGTVLDYRACGVLQLKKGNGLLFFLFFFFFFFFFLCSKVLRLLR
jgi:hypothetical protein